MESRGGQPPDYLLRWRLPLIRVTARAIHHFGQQVMQGLVALVLRRWPLVAAPATQSDACALGPLMAVSELSVVATYEESTLRVRNLL